MNYTEQQRTPAHDLVGAGIVVVMHLVLGWALLTSLASKVVDVIRAPVETKIIEELKPPSPPETPPPPPPEFAPPRPAFVPPPEVRITVPAPIAPTITATIAVAPPAPVTISPVLSAALPVPAATAAPAVRAALPAPAVPTRTAPSLDFNKCEKPEYGAAAARAGVTGTVVVSYAMDTHGGISETKVERSAGASREHKMLDRLTVDAIIRCRGRPGTVDGTPEKLRGSVEYVWKLE